MKLWTDDGRTPEHGYTISSPFEPNGSGELTSSPKGNNRSSDIKQVFFNTSQVSIRFFQLVKGSQLCSPWLDQILTSIKDCNSVANLRKTTIYNTNVDLVNDDVYMKFGLILSIRSQDIE